ncbi:MAG: DUF1684 domain-containing protein [Thermomicrobiales bacterium]
MTERGSRLEGYRRRRDQFFKDHPHSPLNEDQRREFTGLNYFPERPDLVLRLPLDTSGEGIDEQVAMATTDGKVKHFYRAGRISFPVDGQDVTLSVFRDAPHGGFFIPFRDQLAGDETYIHGRYLEPQAYPDGTIEVDLNYAYNPFCAYGDGWSCPIPPAENHLTVPIRAGEAKFSLPGPN